MIRGKQIASQSKGVCILGAALLIACMALSAQAEWKAKVRTTTDAARWTSEASVAITPTAAAATHVDLDTATKYQTMDGFGGAFNELGWKALLVLQPAARDSVIASLFDTVAGCRFVMGRMPIGSSDYCLDKVPLDYLSYDHTPDWYSLDEVNNDTLMTNISVARDSAYLLQYIKAAMKFKPSLKIWGSPWSPPTWMKTNHTYNNGSLTWTPTICRAYALYLEKAVQLYKAQGINFFALSFQNESTQQPVYPGCTWTQNQHRDFIKLYLGPRFTDDNIDCEIWTPTMNCSDMSYFTPMLGDPLCASFITTVCFQWQGKAVLDQLNTTYPYPKFKFYQTEQECGGGETGPALWTYAVANVFYNMKFYIDRFASSYMQWNMVLAPSGKSSWGWPQNAMITIDTTNKKVSYNPQYYVAKHFSFYVQPGAKRIKSSGNFGDQVAFQNPDGSIVVVFSNNNTSPTPLGITFGSNMINVTLPPNSFSTAVIYNGSGVIYKNYSHGGAAIAVRMTRSGNAITLAPPQGSSFILQLVGMNGSVKSSFSSAKDKVCVINADAFSPGMYVLKGLINGKKYFSKIPIVGY
jgi:glucosylceramidase